MVTKLDKWENVLNSKNLIHLGYNLSKIDDENISDYINDGGILPVFSKNPQRFECHAISYNDRETLYADEVGNFIIQKRLDVGIDEILIKIKNAGSLVELHDLLLKIVKLIENCPSFDFMSFHLSDYIDIDKLPVFCDVFPDDDRVTDLDSQVYSYDDTYFLCIDALDVWLEPRFEGVTQ